MLTDLPAVSMPEQYVLFFALYWFGSVLLPTLSIMAVAMGKEIEVAILFADVVGSTKLYEQLGDLRARDMVGICIDVMRAATEQEPRHGHQDHGR